MSIPMRFPRTKYSRYPSGTIGIDAELTFGKYSGRRVRDILNEDPDYLVFLHRETNTTLSEGLQRILTSRGYEL